MTASGRQLLVAIVKGHRRVEDVMEGFLEYGIPGATVIDAKGMGQIVTTDLPIFSGFRSLFPGGGETSYLILSVVDPDQVDPAVEVIRSVCGEFAEKGAGVAFTLPVTAFFGLGS